MKLVHEGFETFRKGTFGNAGANLFVDAKGAVRRIADQDLTGNGHFDMVFPNSHGYIERGPTSIYTKTPDGWSGRELPHDSCWRTRILDVDGDGFDDLLIANGENGVTSILTSYLYWGGKDGLTGERAEFITDGAYDAVAIDLTGNGLKDLVFTSAWYDHHFPGFDYKQKVFLQESPRQFREATDEFNFLCNTIMSLCVADLTGNGYEDLVFIGYKKEGVNDGLGYIYFNGPEGLAKEPFVFPTYLATGAMTADVFGTGLPDLIVTGANKVTIMRNRGGKFSMEDTVSFELVGHRTQFFSGRLGLDVADIDGDGVMEVMTGAGSGLEIRKANDIEHIWQSIPGFRCSGIKAYDFTGCGKMDIVASCYETSKTYDTDSFIFHCVDGKYSMEHITRLPTHGAVNVEVADLDHDGQAEIIFCNTMYGPSQSDPEFPVFCYFGDASLKYPPESRRDYPVDRGAYSYATADVNNDGHPELATTSWNCIRVFPGTADGPDPTRFQEVIDPKERITGGIIMSDLNRDGWLDMIMTSYLDGTTPTPNVIVFWGGPDGYSNENSTILPCIVGSPQGSVLVDINNDGYLDFVYGTKGGNVGILFGSEGGFAPDAQPVTIPAKNANGASIMGLTAADINKDGKLELLTATSGHYTKRRSFLNIYFDPDNLYPLEKQVSFETGGTTGYLSLADLRNTGNLDLILPFYSTEESRVLPLRIFSNNGDGTFDFDNPIKIECESSIASIPIDLNRNGYPDLLICCHRNNLGHMVDSLLFRNGPDGLDLENPERILGYGPHDFTRNIIMNAMDRSESEYYTSPAMDVYGNLAWTAEEPNDTALRMRVRFAETEAALADALWSEPVTNGGALTVPAGAAVMQYQAEFFAPNACGSPRLTKVELW